LFVAARFSASSGLGVVGSEQVKDVGASETHGAIRKPLLVNEQWKTNSGLLPEETGMGPVAESHGGQGGTLALKRALMFAQLRDVLAAKDSSIVPEENQNGRTVLPYRAEAMILPIAIG
jgi:hypothetical protein